MRHFIHRYDYIRSFFFQIRALFSNVRKWAEETSLLSSYAPVFSCEFCEISNNTFFTEHLRTTSSKNTSFLLNRNSLIRFSNKDLKNLHQQLYWGNGNVFVIRLEQLQLLVSLKTINTSESNYYLLLPKQV